MTNSNTNAVSEINDTIKNTVNVSRKKECVNTETKRHKLKLWQKDWRKRNPERHKTTAKRYKLKQQYGITLEQYNSMFDEQKGCCYICHKNQSECKRKLNVDHNHKTGRVRALLCGGCNSMIAHSKENVDTLLAGVEYLRKYNVA